MALRLGEIDRREPQAAVAVDFGKDAAGRQHHQRADVGIDAVADQHLAQARHHRLHQHALDIGRLPDLRDGREQRGVVARRSATTPPTSDLCAISADSALTATG